MKKQIEAPNKRNIDRLLKEMMPGYRDEGTGWEECEELDKQVEQLTSELLDVPQLKELKKKAEEAQSHYQQQRKKIADRVSKLRREFFARGATPSVLKKIADYVDEVNAR